MALFVAVRAEPAAAVPSGKASLGATVPATYIAGYGTRARRCKDMIDASWTGWTTYVRGEVSDEWQLRAGGPKASCKFARRAAGRLIESLGFDDGTGLAKIGWQGYAVTVGDKGTSDEPINHDRPPGWQCFALPSSWGESAWAYAELADLGAPEAEAFAVSQGATAGGGYCVTQASADSGGDWHGGSFVSWLPDVNSCRAAYRLRENPEPGLEEVGYPSYGGAMIWGSYERQAC